MGEFYVTTYCNFAHRIDDGAPINHECIEIPPEALEAEMEGDYETAMEILYGNRSKRHRGVKYEEEKDPAQPAAPSETERG